MMTVERVPARADYSRALLDTSFPTGDQSATSPSPLISLIIPAHNEQDRIGPTIKRYASVFDTVAPGRYEVVVVANGCTDGTVQMAYRSTDCVPSLRVVDIADPIGKGGAVLEGFRRSAGDVVVFADADAATDGQSLVALVDQLAVHDIAIGSRRLPDSVIKMHQPLRRRVAGLAFRCAVRVLFGMPYRDTQCGAKAFRAHVATYLAGAVEECHWAFDVDLLLAARERGYSVKEHPVTWTHVDGSTLALRRTMGQVSASFVSMYWRRQHRFARGPRTGQPLSAR